MNELQPNAIQHYPLPLKTKEQRAQHLNFDMNNLYFLVPGSPKSYYAKLLQFAGTWSLRPSNPTVM